MYVFYVLGGSVELRMHIYSHSVMRCLLDATEWFVIYILVINANAESMLGGMVKSMLV